jgi:hypothetical protein
MFRAGVVAAAAGGAAYLAAWVLAVEYMGQSIQFDAASFGCAPNLQDCSGAASRRPNEDLLVAAGLSALVGTFATVAAVAMIVSSSRRVPQQAGPPRAAWWVPNGVEVDKTGVKATFFAACW